MEDFGLDVTVDHGDETVVHLSGELDVFGVRALREALDEVWANRPSRLILDLSNLHYIDLRGIDGLLDIVRLGREDYIEVVLGHDVPAVERLAQLLHVEPEVLLAHISQG